MTALPITGLYAALLAFVLLWLSLRVINERRRGGVALGTGDSHALLRASRAQGNFVEYVPIILVMLALLEAGGAAAWALHGLGAALLAGRLAHGIGVGREPERPRGGDIRLRQLGMGLTFSVLIAAAAWLLLRPLLP